MNSATKALAGLLVDFARRADLLDPAVRQDGDAVRQGQSLGLVVRDIDRGLAEPALQIAQLLAHLDPQLEVEVGQRLVEHQDPRLEHQRAGDRHALLLAARKAAPESAPPSRRDRRAAGRGRPGRRSPPCRRRRNRSPNATLSNTVRCGNSA